MASYGYTFTSGDTVTPTKLNNARTVSDIVNADIKSDAAIAGTKIAPAFGAQNITVGSADRSIANTTNHALAFGTNNTERMRIDSSGRLLVGTSSVISNLRDRQTAVDRASRTQVIGTTSIGASAAYISYNTATTAFYAPHIWLAKSRSDTESVNVLVSDTESLGVINFAGNDGSSFLNAASIQAEVDGTPGTNDMPGRLVFSTTADGGSSPTERMRIDSAGNVGIGTTNPSSLLTVNGTASATIFRTGTLSTVADAGTDEGALMLSNSIQASRDQSICGSFRRTTSNGAVFQFYRDTTVVGTISVTTTATAYNTSSDYRLKENATPLIGGLSTIEQLQPCEFTWKSDGSTGRGFIAHELQTVVPEAVTGEKDAVDAEGNPEYQGVDASKLVPYLVSAVKELKARVEALEAA